MKDKLSAKDYPIAETRPEQILGRRKKPLDSLTLDAVIDGEVEIEDFRITPPSFVTTSGNCKICWPRSTGFEPRTRLRDDQNPPV